MAGVSVHKMVTKSDFRALAEKMAKAIDKETNMTTMVMEEAGVFHIQQRYGTGFYGRPLFEVVASLSKGVQDPAIYVLKAQAQAVAPAAAEFAKKFERAVKIYEVDDSADLKAEL